MNTHITGGRSPPVNTEEEWENLTREIDLITQDRSILPYMWLSATEGDKNRELATLDHWPETEVINNEAKKLEAEDTVWRDFYTGKRLDNWTKPYYDRSQDPGGDTRNCLSAYTDEPWHESWFILQFFTDKARTFIWEYTSVYVRGPVSIK